MIKKRCTEIIVRGFGSIDEFLEEVYDGENYERETI